MNKIHNTKLNFISFENLDKWYVSYYINPYAVKSNYPFVKLSDIIQPVKDRIAKADYDGRFSIVGKIRFHDGKIHLRDEKKTGMDLYQLKNQDLLVSKINFHQGAVSINNFGDIVSSTHYQPYTVDYSKVIGDYLTLTLRSKRFLDFVKYIRADGIKNEATFEFIGSLKIPLPTKPEQKELLINYKELIELDKKQEEQADKLEGDIDNYLKEVLGIKIVKTSENNQGIRFVDFKNLDRWAVDYLSGAANLSFLRKGNYPTKKIRDLIISYQYGISEKSTSEQIGIPILRMNNIYKSDVVLDDLKYIELSKENKKKFLLTNGDLLFNRTNSKELVGKTAIFDKDEEYTFASYVIRVKFDLSKVNNYYINYLFNSSIGRFQIDMISRKILGQANINSTELQDFIFPIPPISKQKEIASKISSIKTEIKFLRQEAKENRKRAITEFENQIFL